MGCAGAVLEAGLSEARGRRADDRSFALGSGRIQSRAAGAEEGLSRCRTPSEATSQELVLSFVPDEEQRLWRTVMRRKYQLTRNRIQLQNRLEALLEETHIKLSSLVSDLLGASARRMLSAIAKGETDPAILATLADQRLRATQEQLCDALGASRELNPVYRRLLKMILTELGLLERQVCQLDREMGRSAHTASGGGEAAGGGAWVGGGFRAADHRGSRGHSRHISFRQTSGFLGGSLPGRR